MNLGLKQRLILEKGYGKLLSGIKMKVNYNKPFEPMDMDHVNRSHTARELKELVDELTEKKLITTASGNLKYSNLNEKIKYQNTLHPMRLWEYTRVFEICNLKQGMNVLDGGGASSPIVFYCGKKGIDITTLDLQESLIKNTKEVATKMEWNTITAIKRDMTKTGFSNNTFDAIFSISVFEHLPNEIKKEGIKEFARVLKPNGVIGLTFDFGKSVDAKSGYEYNDYDQFHTPIRNIDEIYEYFIKPSGLKLYGNEDLINKISPYKRFVRKGIIANFMEDKSLKKLISSVYLFLNSKYFHYTFYSIFLKKEQ